MAACSLEGCTSTTAKLRCPRCFAFYCMASHIEADKSHGQRCCTLGALLRKFMKTWPELVAKKTTATRIIAKIPTSSIPASAYHNVHKSQVCWVTQLYPYNYPNRASIETLLTAEYTDNASPLLASTTSKTTSGAAKPKFTASNKKKTDSESVASGRANVWRSLICGKGQSWLASELLGLYICHILGRQLTSYVIGSNTYKSSAPVVHSGSSSTSSSTPMTSSTLALSSMTSKPISPIVSTTTTTTIAVPSMVISKTNLSSTSTSTSISLSTGSMSADTTSTSSAPVSSSTQSLSLSLLSSPESLLLSTSTSTLTSTPLSASPALALSFSTTETELKFQTSPLPPPPPPPTTTAPPKNSVIIAHTDEKNVKWRIVGPAYLQTVRITAPYERFLFVYPQDPENYTNPNKWTPADFMDNNNPEHVVLTLGAVPLSPTYDEEKIKTPAHYVVIDLCVAAFKFNERRASAIGAHLQHFCKNTPSSPVLPPPTTSSSSSSSSSSKEEADRKSARADALYVPIPIPIHIGVEPVDSLAARNITSLSSRSKPSTPGAPSSSRRPDSKEEKKYHEHVVSPPSYFDVLESPCTQSNEVQTILISVMNTIASNKGESFNLAKSLDDMWRDFRKELNLVNAFPTTYNTTPPSPPSSASAPSESATGTASSSSFASKFEQLKSMLRGFSS